ncbi:type II toxin-antitoxin system RelE/ParE family toxin [Pollutimonas subterranea]|uniref:type II toxin-antitoxin system RelE/ParE family toxin n=1 Tax=Pollutimonas subterranea TaxID=2045210 RepID=UPI00117E5F4F|nr:type II toxin-antitoxin system RelE/ParE family toxin [Pollutimonas subterranea]
MNYPVVFAPEAEDQVVALYNYIAKAASPDIAKRYTDSVLSYCESFQSFPNRGYLRNDIRPANSVQQSTKIAGAALPNSMTIDNMRALPLIFGCFYQ